MIPWSKHNPDTAQAHLIKMLPKLWKAEWGAGERKKYTQAPEGHRAVTVRVGDKFHAYAIPNDVHMITLKCALRWYHKGRVCHGKGGCYSVEF